MLFSEENRVCGHNADDNEQSRVHNYNAEHIIIMQNICKLGKLVFFLASKKFRGS